MRRRRDTTFKTQEEYILRTILITFFVCFADVRTQKSRLKFEIKYDLYYIARQIKT